ncbi:MAG: hypothetical protein Crog4KO_36720 [Crocinitomicaceae bacterium]
MTTFVGIAVPAAGVRGRAGTDRRVEAGRSAEADPKAEVAAAVAEGTATNATGSTRSVKHHT